MQNPFFHRGPIRDPAYFVGRQHALDQILALLANTQSVSIVGPRRIGKTSLLMHLSNPAVYAQAGIAPERVCFVFVDCDGWPQVTQADVYALLLEELRDALEAAGHCVALPDQPAQASYRTFEQAIRAVVRQQIQLVFMLDEFDALSKNQHLDTDFFSSLRALATRHRVAYITSSTRPLLDLTYTQANVLSSPFFNFFAQIRLALLDDDEAAELLSRLSARGGAPFSPATADALRGLAGPHPLLLQIAAYHAFETLARRPGAAEDLDAEAQGHFLSDAQAHWTYFWSILAPQDQRLLALLPLLWRSDPAGVKRLEHAALVVRRGAEVAPLSASFAAFVGQQQVPGLVQSPPVTLDPQQRTALLRGQVLDLTRAEFDLLACLMTRAGQVITHRELDAQIWHDEIPLDPERLKTTVKTLRRALGADAGCVQNIRGVGYTFAAP